MTKSGLTKQHVHRSPFLPLQPALHLGSDTSIAMLARVNAASVTMGSASFSGGAVFTLGGAPPPHSIVTDVCVSVGDWASTLAGTLTHAFVIIYLWGLNIFTTAVEFRQMDKQRIYVARKTQLNSG